MSIDLNQTVRLSEYLSLRHPLSNSPFKKKRISRKVQLFLKLELIKIVEFFFKKEILVTEKNSFFYRCSAETRALLLFLSSRGYLLGWKHKKIQGISSVEYFELRTPDIEVPDYGPARLIGSVGNGVSKDLDEAIRISISEFTERLTVSCWDKKDMFLLNNKHEISDKVKNFSHTGEPVQNQKDIRWMYGVDWLSGEKIIFPAAFAYIFYYNCFSDEERITDVSTSGAASHITRSLSEYGAVIELIERDNYMYSWYSAKSHAQITLESILEVFPERAAFFEAIKNRKNMDYRFIDVSRFDGIYTFACIQKRTYTKGYSATAVLACDVSSVESMRKLLDELEMMIIWEDQDRHAEPNGVPKSIESVCSMSDRARYWNYRLGDDELEWLFSKERINFRDSYGVDSSVDTIEKKNIFVKNILRENNIRLYMKKYSNKLTHITGLHVCRAISPDLIPIFFDERRKPFGVSTFRDFGDKKNIIPHNML